MSLDSTSFLVGFAFLAAANLFMRRPDAPPLGSGPRRWPWQHREYYTPRGYVLHIAGLFLWGIAVLISIYELIRR